MDIQLVSSFSTTVSVLRDRESQVQQGLKGSIPHTPHPSPWLYSWLQLSVTLTVTYLRSMSLGFLATYWATRSLSSVRRMSVKYSSLP